MGACTSQNDFNSNTKKIIRVYSLQQKDLKCTAQVLDVETSKSFNTEIKLFFFKNLWSVSQITVENLLFLIGQQNEDCNAGSLFIMYDLTDNLAQYSLLVNSTYEHNKCALTIFKRDFIVALGGKNSVKCEIYSKNSKKWRTLPDLPEERFGCGIITDDLIDTLYCFGGMNSSKRSFVSSIIKVNLKGSSIWEAIVMKDESIIIERAFFCIARGTKDSFLIFGGTSPETDFTDTIYEYEINKKNANQAQLKLAAPCRFDNYSYAIFSSVIYVIDEDCRIHTVYMKEGRAIISCT